MIRCSITEVKTMSFSAFQPTSQVIIISKNSVLTFTRSFGHLLPSSFRFHPSSILLQRASFYTFQPSPNPVSAKPLSEFEFPFIFSFWGLLSFFNSGPKSTFFGFCSAAKEEGLQFQRKRLEEETRE